MLKEKVSVKNKVRNISVKDGKIVYTLLRDGVKDYADYNDTLYQILKKDRLRPFRNNGRLKFNVRDGGIDHTFYLYDLAIACYRGEVKLETFLEDMQKYSDRKCNLDVDHADSNKHNNTMLNISLMDSGLNRSKNEIVARFKPPYYINSVYCDGEYRIQFATRLDQSYVPKLTVAILEELKKYGITGMGVPTTVEAQAEMRYICKDAEDYVACLKYFANHAYGWCNPEQTPKEHNRENKKLKYWAADIKKSIQKQNELAAMDRTEFQMWPVDKELIMAEKSSVAQI